MAQFNAGRRPVQNVIIIGAPRSGTNMLRELLCSIDGVSSWPCDEINYMWRHGNTRYPSDAFTADMAKPWLRDYIGRKFQWVSRRYQAHTVVEKTCANSLRVLFVDRVLDDPKYVFIHRDGMDAVASAMTRWKAPLDLPYVLRKARFVPIFDIPYYGARYLGTRLSRLWSSEGRLSLWGPVVPEMSRMRTQHDLAGLCSVQWQACVEYALDAFEEIGADRVLRIAYEDLVNHKDVQASRIAEFLELDQEVVKNSSYLGYIRASSVGKGHSQLCPETRSRVSAIIGPTMMRLGYR